MRAVSLAVLSLAPVAFFGCAKPAASSTEAGARPQRIASREQASAFVGDWGPGTGYVANDWIVRFTKDGRISVRGPGMVARGSYIAEGRLAAATYAARDGGSPAGSLSQGSFSLSSDGRELTFTTGLPNDPPVRLQRRP